MINHNLPHRAIKALPQLLQTEVTLAWQALQTNGNALLAELTEIRQQQLVRVLAASPYVARQLATKPNLLDWGTLNCGFEAAQLQQQLRTLLASVDSEVNLMNRLRQFRHRHMVRLMWRNQLRLCSSEALVTELSHLADCCIKQALSWLHNEAAKQWGHPLNGKGEKQQLVVLALGKLGGQELNLSSDVDLIFAFTNAGITQGGPRSLSHQAFFIRLGQKLIHVLNHTTADGFVFRVDMRLRPYGNSGALALGFNSLELYYQKQGREWERYALIKARVVAGDQQAGAALLQLLKPFVYRRYLDYSAIEALRSMKQMINRAVKQQGLADNVKLGHGGIREIEFIVQVVQLIRGGRDTRLQTASLMAVLQQLSTYLGMTELDIAELRQAYWFLRDLEHALQAVQDHQTQKLPTDTLEQQRIAIALGYCNWQTLQNNYNHWRNRVHHHYHQIIAKPRNSTDKALSQQEEFFTELWQLLEHPLDQSQQQSHLESQINKHGFQQPQQVIKCLQDIHTSRAARTMQSIGRQRLDQLMPQLLVLVLKQTQPETTLMRSLVLVEAVLQRSVYLVLLLENPTALMLLVRLCGNSAWFSEFLARQPLLLDELLNVNSLFQVNNTQEMAQELEQHLLCLPMANHEHIMAAMRYFKNVNLLRIAAMEVTEQLALTQVSDQLTQVAEILLQEILQQAWQELVTLHGHPCNEMGPCDQFIIVGYGKVGGLELSYSSDLDLVFIYQMPETLMTNGQRPIANTVFLTRLGQRIIHLLNTMTADGRLYEVDMRLRPDGSKGLLVTSLATFERYQLNEAWTWEHQALTRARPLAGCEQLQQEFRQVRRRVLGQPRCLTKLKTDVVTMRNRIRKSSGRKANSGSHAADVFHLKQDAGGIVDIEFLVQYAVLAYGYQYPQLLTYTDNIRILDNLQQVGLITIDDAQDLCNVYRSLRSIQHRLTLQNQANLVVPETLLQQRRRVQCIWQQLINLA